MDLKGDDLSFLEDDIEIEPISEAPGDEDNGGGDNVDLAANDDAGTDNPDQGDQNNAEDNADNQNADDNQDDNTNDNNQQNNTDQETDDNFDVNVDDDNPDEGGGDDNAPADNAGNDQEGGEEEPEETDAEKELNSELDSIYNNLTPMEKQKRDEILRDHYRTLFNAVDLLINNTQDFPKTTDTIKMIKRLIRNLNDFKDYISYYFTTVYSTKSHLENLTRFRQFLQIYSGIASIYNDLNETLGHDFDKYGRNVEELEKMYSIED